MGDSRGQWREEGGRVHACRAATEVNRARYVISGFEPNFGRGVGLVQNNYVTVIVCVANAAYKFSFYVYVRKKILISTLFL